MSRRRPDDPQRLTEKQRQFVEEYLIDLNGTQAAIRAGYAPKAAAQTANKLLRSGQVSRAIGEQRQKMVEKTQVDQAFVLNGLVDVALRCRQARPVERWSRESRSMVQVTDENGAGIYQFDSAGANRALELIGKHLGMFNERPVESQTQNNLLFMSPQTALALLRRMGPLILPEDRYKLLRPPEEALAGPEAYPGPEADPEADPEP